MAGGALTALECITSGCHCTGRCTATSHRPTVALAIQKKSYCQVGGAAILSRGHRPTALHNCSQSAAFGSRLAERSAVEHCSSSFHFFCFRMRAKTSEFLKVLNRAKIEEESKKKGSKIGAKSPFI